MLDEILIIRGGESGKTPMMQNNVRTGLKKGFVVDLRGDRLTNLGIIR
jgi:hypothetical protein